MVPGMLVGHGVVVRILVRLVRLFVCSSIGPAMKLLRLIWKFLRPRCSTLHRGRPRQFQLNVRGKGLAGCGRDKGMGVNSLETHALVQIGPLGMGLPFAANSC